MLGYLEFFHRVFLSLLELGSSLLVFFGREFTFTLLGTEYGYSLFELIFGLGFITLILVFIVIKILP